MAARRAGSAAVLAACVACAAEPPQPEPAAAARIVVVEADGVDAPDGVDGVRGSLLGLQVHLTPADYATERRFEDKLRATFVQADEAGLIDARTVVVLPEYVGTWLVLLDAPAEAFAAATLGDAMTPVATSDLPAYLAARLGADVEDADAHAIFSSKSERMAAAYQGALSRLARDFGVVLVGGSIVLPRPRVEDGAIRVVPGDDLVNASFVFDATGALFDDVVVKAFPTTAEQGFTVAGRAAHLPVFDTPVGRLGVLVCADAWFPETYDVLAEKGVDVAAVPAFMEGDRGFFEAPWRGYSGHPAPDDVDLDDVGVLTEEEAWVKYALPGRLHAASARAGLVVNLRGSFWDLHDEGRSFAATPGRFEAGPLDDAPLLLSLRF